MEELSKYNKFVEKVLKEMFQLVGLEYSPEFCAKKEWYLKKSWDEKTENEFKRFFIKSAQKDLKLNKSMAEKEFLWFNLAYGWKENHEK